MPASSQASSALSTASLTQVSSALRGLSKPSKWRFLVKNSETEISRWRAPISAAEIVSLGSTPLAAPFFGIGLDIVAAILRQFRLGKSEEAQSWNTNGSVGNS